MSTEEPNFLSAPEPLKSLGSSDQDQSQYWQSFLIKISFYYGSSMLEFNRGPLIVSGGSFINLQEAYQEFSQIPSRPQCSSSNPLPKNLGGLTPPYPCSSETDSRAFSDTQFIMQTPNPKFLFMKKIVTNRGNNQQIWHLSRAENTLFLPIN